MTRAAFVFYLVCSFFVGGAGMLVYYSVVEGLQCNVRTTGFQCERRTRVGTTSVERPGRVQTLPEVTITPAPQE